MTAASEIWQGPSRPSLAGVLPELFRRQPAMALLGILLAALVIPAVIAAGLDPRVLDGEEVWSKPAKFLASTSLFALTSAWMFGYVTPEARRGRTAAAIVAILWTTFLFEDAYISLQAWRGERSHFNFTDPLHSTLFGLMGAGAVLMVTTCLMQAWLIARRPAPGLRAPFRDALVIGLVFTFLLGGGLGGYMSTHGGHWTSAAGADTGLPLFGWSRIAGDLRPPHFLGIHAQQLVPLLALAVPGRGAGSRLAVWAIGAVYAALTLAAFWISLSDRPLIPAGLLPGLG
jgi:hypothetical protein